LRRRDISELSSSKSARRDTAALPEIPQRGAMIE
jgi:hypothetical protein